MSLPRLCALALLLAPLPLLAAPDEAKKDGGKSIDERRADDRRAEAAAGWADAPVAERAVVTDHAVTAGGRSWRYKATAGTLTLRDQEGKPVASMFYTAYTLDGVKPGSKRPITFFYNGGPGSPSFWLHMGSFAPMRLRTTSPEFIRPAPYDFGPNPDTLLPKTDMVFLDAIGTGWSRPLGDAKPADFYGTDQDADAFAKGILRYVDKFGRWSSPKVLFGESYGTTRSGALAYQLQSRGMALNGVVLLSSIMNYGYRQPGLDQIYLNYLPSYAATAWYHNRVPDRPRRRRELRRAGARVRGGALCRGAGQGPVDHAGGARCRCDAACALHRALAAISRRRQSARRSVAVPQGAAAVRAAERRPL